jgi:hypothetical protein
MLQPLHALVKEGQVLVHVWDEAALLNKLREQLGGEEEAVEGLVRFVTWPEGSVAEPSVKYMPKTGTYLIFFYKLYLNFKHLSFQRTNKKKLSSGTKEILRLGNTEPEEGGLVKEVADVGGAHGGGPPDGQQELTVAGQQARHKLQESFLHTII